MKKDTQYLLSKKQAQQKISMLTCYDYPTAVLEEQAGTDVVLVGDSVGTNVLGYDSATEVTMDDIVHHLKAVRRGVSQAYLLADLPSGTYATPEQALKNAKTLLAHGADGVKLEGVHSEIVAYLGKHGIDVCGHVGLLPQIHQKKTVQGKNFAQAKELIEGAITLEKAGVFMIVLELIPEEVGQFISQQLAIPTIGIGAGRFTDGQVLVINDVLGITPQKFRLAKRYQDYQQLTLQAIASYQLEVEQSLFPSEANVSHMAEAELKQLADWVQQNLVCHSI